MNRKDFQRLARLRLREARALLRGGHYEGAYYLSGYVVECGLKACIARRTKQHDFPDKKAVLESYTHDFPRLVVVAELKDSLDVEATADPNFRDNWDTVAEWSEESRYRLSDRQEARTIYFAVAGRKHGVLRWIRRHW